jgi:hypothetical protein
MSRIVHIGIKNGITLTSLIFPIMAPYTDLEIPSPSDDIIT